MPISTHIIEFFSEDWHAIRTVTLRCFYDEANAEYQSWCRDLLGSDTEVKHVYLSEVRRGKRHTFSMASKVKSDFRGRVMLPTGTYYIEYPDCLYEYNAASSYPTIRAFHTYEE